MQVGLNLLSSLLHVQCHEQHTHRAGGVHEQWKSVQVVHRGSRFMVHAAMGVWCAIQAPPGIFMVHVLQSGLPSALLSQFVCWLGGLSAMSLQTVWRQVARRPSQWTAWGVWVASASNKGFDWRYSLYDCKIVKGRPKIPHTS